MRSLLAGSAGGSVRSWTINQGIHILRHLPVTLLADKTLGNDTVPETDVADGQRTLVELVHHRPQNARASENYFSALWLQAENLTARLRVARSIHLDLAVDLGAVEDTALDGGRVIFDQTMLDRCDISHRTTHCHC